jgi:hypothetical protein
MSLFRKQCDAIKNSVKPLASAIAARIAALGSLFLTAAILGTSYLGVTIVASIARFLVEVTSRTPREI